VYALCRRERRSQRRALTQLRLLCAADFHILKMMTLVSLLILSYALIEVVDADIFLSLTCYSIALFILIGLQQIAVASALTPRALRRRAPLSRTSQPR
jgi:hypothetical protein